MAKRHYLMIAVLLLAVAVAALSTRARADSGTMSCVGRLDPLQPGQDAAEVAEQECYDTFDEAIRSLGLNPDDYRGSPDGTATMPTATPGVAIEGDPEQHCVALLDPIQAGESESKVGKVSCFTTFEEAIATATDNAVQLPSNTNPSEITPGVLEAAQTTVVIGIDYVDTKFGGTSYVWATAHTPGCGDGSTYGVTGMPAGWNDVVSSARSYSGCNHFYHYQDTWWGGPLVDCGGSCSSMGVMDNQTSSVRLTP